MPNPPNLSDAQKLWTGYVLGGLFFTACLLISASALSTPWLNVLICLLGAVSGWTAGIVATPFDDDERTKFLSLVKGFLALGSGYVIAKLEDPVVRAVEGMVQESGAALVMSVSLFCICFLVGLLFTLVTRMYGEGATERNERKRAQLLGTAQQIMEKLEKLKNRA